MRTLAPPRPDAAGAADAGPVPATVPAAPGAGRTALVACGALAREVRDLAGRRGWDVDLHALPAFLHMAPPRIVAELDRLLERLRGRGGRAVVVYGDCGTAGAIDRVLARHGAERVAGPHCYEMFGGDELARLLADRPGTFLLTDWLVANFDLAVVRGLGLDRHPELREVYFAHYTGVLYLAQDPTPEREAAAARAAAYLGLPLEIWDRGLGDLEERLTELVERGPAPPGRCTETTPEFATAVGCTP